MKSVKIIFFSLIVNYSCSMFEVDAVYFTESDNKKWFNLFNDSLSVNSYIEYLDKPNLLKVLFKINKNDRLSIDSVKIELSNFSRYYACTSDSTGMPGDQAIYFWRKKLTKENDYIANDSTSFYLMYNFKKDEGTKLPENVDINFDFYCTWDTVKFKRSKQKLLIPTIIRKRISPSK